MQQNSLLSLEQNSKNIRNCNFSIHKLKHKVAISKSVEQLLVALTGITKHVSISIYIHKKFVNLPSETMVLIDWLIDWLMLPLKLEIWV